MTALRRAGHVIVKCHGWHSLEVQLGNMNDSESLLDPKVQGYLGNQPPLDGTAGEVLPSQRARFQFREEVGCPFSVRISAVSGFSYTFPGIQV